MNLLIDAKLSIFKGNTIQFLECSLRGINYIATHLTKFIRILLNRDRSLYHKHRTFTSSRNLCAHF